MYVEFFALPGTGKTTICKNLSNHNSTFIYSYSDLDSIKKLKAIITIKTLYIFMSIWFRIFFNFIKNILLIKVNRSPFNNSIWFSKQLFVSIYRILKVQKERSDKVYLFDHGLIQTLSQLPYLRNENEPRRLLKKIINKFSRFKTQFIYLDNTIEIAKARAIKSEKENYNRTDKCYDEDFKFFKDIYSFLPRMNKHKINARKNQTTVKDEAINYIKTIMNKRKVTLKLCTSFFKKLNETKVPYCHFKSNNTLTNSFNGIEDFDLLVDFRYSKDFESLLSEFGYKEIISPKFKKYQGIKHYLGLDYNTGNFSHIHLHYIYRTGDHLLKQYILPIETFLLKNTSLDNTFPIKVPKYHIELIFSIMRFLLKYKQIRFKKNNRLLTKEFKDDLIFLKSKDDCFRLAKKITESIFKDKKIDEEFKSIINKFIDIYEKNQITPKHINHLSSKLKNLFKIYRSENRTKLWIKSLYQKGIIIFNSRFSPNSNKKTLNKGILVAFVGAPGSGKSTLTRTIESWLSEHIVCRRYYMGLPQKGFLVYVSKIFSIIFYHIKKITIKIIPKPRMITNPIIFLSDISSCIELICVARNRIKLYKKMVKQSHKRKVILSDRFPIKEIYTNENLAFEGPKILGSIEKLSKLTQFFAKIERKYYDKITKDNRYRIIVLNIDPNTAILRGRDPNLVHKKIGMMKHLKSNNKIFTFIDSNQSFQKVLIDTKIELWKQVLNKS